jgi:hypothetical protein
MLKRTKLGLLHALLVQYDGLRLSAAMYDAGHRGEAVRIANAIFVLIGPDMRNHKSILNQLGQEGALQIPSTADSRGPHGSALIAVEVTPYVNEESGLGGWIIAAVPYGHEALNSGRTASVSDWWNEGVLRGSGAVGTLTRLQVVRVMRDQDGGAHLDDHIKDKVYLAVHLSGVGFQYKAHADAKETKPVEGALEATVRQMAYEVLHGIQSRVLSAQVTLAEASKKGPLTTQFFEEKPDSP